MRFKQIAPFLLLALAVEPASAEQFREVGRILRFNCTACHNQVEAQGELDLSATAAHANLVDREASGARAKLVVPGKPDESYLLAKLLGTHLAAGGSGATMPISGRLADEDIEAIRQWILTGALP